MMGGSNILNINLTDLEDQASGFIDLYLCMIEGFQYLTADCFFEIPLNDLLFQTFDFQNPHVAKHGLILQLRNVNKIAISPFKNSNQRISVELQTSGAHWVLFNMLGTFIGAITGGTTIFPKVRPLQPAPSLSKSGTNG